jgi:PAS domain S-box-containing protein
MDLKNYKCKTIPEAWGTKVIFLSLLVIHCLITSVAAVELTEGERTFIRNKGSIVFVSQSNYPPFEFTNPVDGQREGMMLDVVRWLAVELGFQPKFIDMSFQQAQEAVQEGRADVLTSLFHSEQRATRFSFTQPLFDVPASIFVRVDETGIRTLEDLHGKTVAMQRGDYAGEFLKSKGINCTIMNTDDFAEATDLVIGGRADAVIGDVQIVLYHLHSHHLGDRMRTVGPPLYVGSNCMAARIDNARLIAILKKGIDGAARAGVLDKIEKKWFGPSYGAQETFFNRYGLAIAVIAGVMLGLALAAWLWNMQLRKKVRIATELINRREQSLRESESNLRTFFDSMADLVFVGDHQGSILHCNNAAVLKLGRSRAELLTMNFIDLHPQHLREEALAIVTAMVAGTTDTCPLPLENKDGRPLLVETRVWHGHWGGLPCLFGLCKDLGKEQEALQRFNRLFHANPTCLALTDPQTGKFMEVNAAFLTLTGYGREEVIGATSGTLRLFSDPEKQQNAAQELMTLGSVRNIELLVRCKNGDLLDGLFSGEVIESQGQRYFLTVMIDQTARKRAERLLRASEAEYRRLFETIIDIYWRIDRKGVITSVSPSATRITGYRQEELLGTDIRSYAINPIDQFSLMSRMIKEGFVERLVLMVRAKNGEELWLSCNARIERDEDGAFSCIEGIARDITEAHEARITLQQELSFRSAIINNVVNGLCVCHEIAEYPFVRFSVWNDRMIEITGHSQESINRLGWYQSLYPDPNLQQKAIERMQKMRQGMDLRAEEWEITRADGGKRIVTISTSFVAGDNGEVHVLAVLSDITERRKAEKERLRLERELLETRKRESLMRMAGATAHHFNNNLGVVLGYLELILDKDQSLGENRTFLVQALQALNKAIDLGRFMFRYSTQDCLDKCEVNVTEEVEGLTPHILPSLPERVNIKKRLGQGLPSIMINRKDLQLIFSNIVMNGAEAMGKDGGMMSISTGSGYFQEKYLRRGVSPLPPPAGRYVYIRICDQGCGMDTQTLDRMFDPFFSTKFTGRGLGLALVEVIVRNNQGGIVVETRPNEGTTVVVLFPVGRANQTEKLPLPPPD